MDSATELLVRDVRCFHGEQRGALRPLTLLVGENSTGKTTFLACCAVMHRLASDALAVADFNREPFLLGAFRDIVRSRRGPAGRIDEFGLGLRIAPPDGDAVTFSVTFQERGSQPFVASCRFDRGDRDFVEATRIAAGRVRCVAPEATFEVDVPPSEDLLSWVFFLSEHKIARSVRGEASRQWRGVVKRMHGMRTTDDFEDWFAAFYRLPSATALAPLRSRPRRTYDPVRETASPEGAHTPMLLMRLHRTDKPHWTPLHRDLVEFGAQSGLFSDIKVKTHGGQMSDPFQLQVKAGGSAAANIMDVGYGVSQSLPILVDVMEKKRELFLLQQPEVHLHPRGQAALASLFVDSVRKRGNRFVIETHSDFIIDRVRIAVGKGLLRASDVSILYFEPTARKGVRIHDMTLGPAGDLQGVPKGYREFFLEETDRLFGVAD